MDEQERQICGLEKEVAVLKQEIKDSALALSVARTASQSLTVSVVAVILGLLAIAATFLHK